MQPEDLRVWEEEQGGEGWRGGEGSLDRGREAETKGGRAQGEVARPKEARTTGG
jgi:hypothetical protein